MSQYPYYESYFCENFREFLTHLESYGDKTAICWYNRARQKFEKTYKELCSDVRALRRALNAHGLSKERVAIAGENSYNWIVTFLAVTSGGGIAICVDTDQSDEMVIDLLKLADTTVVFASESIMPICKALPSHTSKIQKVFWLNADDNSVDSLIEEGRGIENEDNVVISGSDIAAIMFTSGTTACAKAVMHTHSGILTNTGSAMRMVNLGDSNFSGLPFFHTYGLNCGVFCPLLMGDKLTINGDLRTMRKDLQDANPGTVFAVPLIMESIYRSAWVELSKHDKVQEVEKLIKYYWIGKKFGLNLFRDQREKVHDTLFGNLRLIVCGGAHLNPEISKKLGALGVKVLQGYGITECAPLISVNRNEYAKYDSVGMVLPGIQIRLDDGEIVVKGPNVMAGYYNNPEETKNVLEDGWFHTGDLGRIDWDGQIYITGRIKNLIVLKNGKKVSPEQIEQRIQEIPIVKETMVYGTPSGKDLDDVLLTVSVFPNPEMTKGMDRMEILEAVQKEIDKFNNTLPDYQQLKLVNIRDREFEKTSTKKAKRNDPNNRQ